MATGTDKFLNYNGLVKLIGLIKKRINDAISWKSNVFVKDVVGIHTANQQDSADANVTFVEQSATVTLGKLDGTGTNTTHNITFTDAQYGLVKPPNGTSMGLHGLMNANDKAKLDNLSATGAGKGANLVKYDSTANATAGSVAEAIKNLQGAVGGGDLVKSVDNATQDNSTYDDDNIIPNNPRTGNYTKADGTSGTFTYYDTRYGLAMASQSQGPMPLAGLNGLMSAADKERLYTINSSIPLSENINVGSTATTTVQEALLGINRLADSNASNVSVLQNNVTTLQNLVDALQSGGLTREVVTTLPTGSAIKTNVIYMILASNDSLDGGDPSTSATTTPYGTNNNSYNEYMYINNAWERIGSTEVNLDIDPITDDEIDTAWSTTAAAA